MIMKNPKTKPSLDSFPRPSILNKRIRNYVDRQKLSADDKALLYNAIYGALQSAKSVFEAQKQSKRQRQDTARTITKRLLRRGKDFVEVLEKWVDVHPASGEALLKVRHVLNTAKTVAEMDRLPAEKRGKPPRAELQVAVSILAGAYQQIFNVTPTVEKYQEKGTKTKFHLFSNEVFSLADIHEDIPPSTLSDALMSWRAIHKIPSVKSVKKPRIKKSKMAGIFG